MGRLRVRPRSCTALLCARCCGHAAAEVPRFSTAVRLVGGSGPYQGRVEVLRWGAWLPVCGFAGWHPWSLGYPYFDQVSASIVCRQLGYTGGARLLETPGTFGSSNIAGEFYDWNNCFSAAETAWQLGLASCPYWQTFNDHCPDFPGGCNCTDFAAVTCSTDTGVHGDRSVRAA